ncbi:MAG: lytic murein transglycosylase [Desulfobacteraceae bacterium]|nr:lytic murein transglycosylase [Desulfobacteraceae bacterium]
MHFNLRNLCAISTLLIIALNTIVSPAMASDTEKSFFNTLTNRLIEDGFNAQWIKNLYKDEKVFFESKGVSAYFLYTEASLNYKKMTKRPWIHEAKGYMKKHKNTLSLAEKRYGVNARVITAIILVETKFGRYVGNRSILNTLSTMSVLTESAPREFLWNKLPAQRRFERIEYDKKADRKSAWAYNELKAFLIYTKKHQFDPLNIVGSYAGALGIAQFMPSNILTYGQDGNGDGKIDLFHDADSIFSIANYLKNFGWKPGINRKAAYKVVYQYNHSSYYVNTILEITDLLKA